MSEGVGERTAREGVMVEGMNEWMDAWVDE
jgi:hypothetical protein